MLRVQVCALFRGVEVIQNAHSEGRRHSVKDSLQNEPTSGVVDCGGFVGFSADGSLKRM